MRGKNGNVVQDPDIHTDDCDREITNIRVLQRLPTLIRVKNMGSRRYLDTNPYSFSYSTHSFTFFTDKHYGRPKPNSMSWRWRFVQNSRRDESARALCMHVVYLAGNPKENMPRAGAVSSSLWVGEMQLKCRYNIKYFL